MVIRDCSCDIRLNLNDLLGYAQTQVPTHEEVKTYPFENVPGVERHIAELWVGHRTEGKRPQNVKSDSALSMALDFP